MSIKELYEWAVEHNVEDWGILIQYRDGGGGLCGTDTLYSCDIEIDYLRNKVIL